MAKSARFGIYLLGFLLFVSGAYAQPSNTTSVERVDIRGRRRIPEDTIRSTIVQTRPGEPYDEARIDYDLKALYRTNYFEDIGVEEKDGDIGKIITFILKEKPFIHSIEYKGNKSFTESNIQDAYKEKKVGLTVESRYDPTKIRAAERVLRDLLLQNGKPLGTVRTDIEPISDSSVHVRFIVDEGISVRIGKMRFTGNTVFKENNLKAALKLNKERSIMTMFKGTDKYHREKLDYDIETNLKALYQERGYMNVQIGTPLVRIFEGPRGTIPMLRKTRNQFFIEIPVDAGDQYRIGKLELKDCGPYINCEALVQSYGLKKGDILNWKRIKDNNEEIKKLYSNIGFLNYSSLPDIKSDPANKTYDLTFTLQPDKQFYVKRINFLGNTKTRDRVLRREFVLEEGKVFSGSLLDTSILRLNQLGFFEKVEEKDYEVKPDDKTALVDVSVTVKEKSRRSIGFTGGISGISGSFLGLNYSDNNFLGRGSNLELSFTGGTRQTNYLLSFTEPYLMDTRWTMGVSLFNQRYRYDTYTTYGVTNESGDANELFTQRTTGATLSFNRRFARSLWSMGTSYTYQKIGITNIAKGFESFAQGQFSGLSAGSNSTTNALKGIIRSEITPLINYNSTNGYYNATQGTSLTLSSSISGGLLGGNFSMIRPSLEYRFFFPDKWLSHGRNVFAFNLQLQFIQSFGNSSVPFFDRFYIGGENTVRGFDLRSISPIAVTSTPRYDTLGNPIIDLKTGLPRVDQSKPFSVGGDTIGVFNFEYRMPIAGPLSMAAFYDVGIARATRKDSFGNFGTSKIDIIGSTNNTLRGSTGLEIQFVLPVVSAPFRLIFAYNPQRLNDSITTTTGIWKIREPSKDIKFTVGRSF